MTSAGVQKARSGVFIDGANLFWAGRSLEAEGKERWTIDFLKLKEYLKQKYSPAFFKFYDCVDEKPTNAKYVERAVGSSNFHKKLSGYGYDVILKPLKYIQDKHTKKIFTKGDMDVAIVVDIKNALSDIDNVILFSGDSDFLPVVQDAHAAGKYIRVYSYQHTLAWELKDFAIKNVRCNYMLIDGLRDKLDYTAKKWCAKPRA